MLVDKHMNIMTIHVQYTVPFSTRPDNFFAKAKVWQSHSKQRKFGTSRVNSSSVCSEPRCISLFPVVSRYADFIRLRAPFSREVQSCQRCTVNQLHHSSRYHGDWQGGGGAWQKWVWPREWGYREQGTQLAFMSMAVQEHFQFAPKSKYEIVCGATLHYVVVRSSVTVIRGKWK